MSDDTDNTDDEVAKAVEYLTWALGRRKKEIDRDRFLTSLQTAFFQGYNANFFDYPTNSMTLHRGRTFDGHEVYEEVSDLWYPPAKFTQYNRASFPGESVFYCASGNATALLELRPKVGQVISMMTCTVTKPRVRIKLVAGEAYFNELGLSARQLPFELLCNKAFRIVANRPFDYFVCSGLGSLLFKFTDLDGICFPSVATDLYGVNFALRPEIVDQFIRPVSFRAYLVREVKSSFDFIVQCVASAPEATKDDSIAWDELPSCPGHRVSLAVYDRPCSD